MKRILSGITPSGDGTLHIGNYLGAVKQFIQLGKTHECFLMFADLHALTTVQNKSQLQKNTENLILNEIALVGFDNPNVVFFRQSDVPLHAELQTILNNVTPLGLIKRAHAYKDKLAKDVSEDEVNLGLFNYPVLMAADILLYKPDAVPVGKDQKQHIEITRDIAEKFNSIFKTKIFKLPDAHIPEDVAVVLGTDGKRKMSKSLGNIISIFESEEVIGKQVNSTFTDPTRKHANDPGHVEGNMVFSYLTHFGDKQKVINYKEKYIKGEVSDTEVKEYLFDSLLTYFTPARKRYAELKSNPKQVKEILEKGAARVRTVASQTMKEVRQTIGITNQYSFFNYSFEGKTEFITIDQFATVDERVGKVIEAKNAEGSEKLIRLTVDFGANISTRVIFTAVRTFGFTPEFFQGKQFFFVVNLAPRKMMNEFSQGMILAVDSSAGSEQVAKPIFLSAEGMPLGARIG
jgi:tryptophanyl-tRNA synthetase